MPSNPWPLIRRLIRPPSGDAVPDAELLRRFAEGRDQAAFELLVWRHGGMVLGVCRRVLRAGHAAEDAFQAAFPVLARKAGSVRAGASVAGWLHRVARRVALRAAKQRATRRQRETALVADPPARASAEPDAELRALLDAEIDRLPERFRLPVVLCYLDGRTTEDAARLLGVPRGTVLSRLATARQRLAARLTRRVVTLPASGLFGVGRRGQVRPHSARTRRPARRCAAVAGTEEVESPTIKRRKPTRGNGWARQPPANRDGLPQILAGWCAHPLPRVGFQHLMFLEVCHGADRAFSPCVRARAGHHGGCPSHPHGNLP
jgi:RNA polymerase sigma factor (sigma-70 family)